MWSLKLHVVDAIHYIAEAALEWLLLQSGEVDEDTVSNVINKGERILLDGVMFGSDSRGYYMAGSDDALAPFVAQLSEGDYT